jgi:serine phosphatase RsbU (regulator of sigma subunit)/ligand-binding sensor domain-containing protein
VLLTQKHIKIWCITLLQTLSILHLRAQTETETIIDVVDTKSIGNPFITSVFQDQKGYIWLGTLSGIARYDGYVFKKYNHVPGDSGSIHWPTALCFSAFHKSDFLIGTSNGLSCYHYATNKFSEVPIDSNSIDTDQKIVIKSITTSPEGNKILATKNGLLQFNAIQNRVEAIKHGKKTLLAGWDIMAVYTDRKGNIWAGCKKKDNTGKVEEAVFKCNINKHTVIRFDITNTGGSANISGISEDYLGNIWASVDDGLISINTSSNKQQFYKAPNNFFSSVTFHLTRDNTIWQCYWSFGITSFDIDKKQFKIYSHEPGNNNSLMSNKVWAIFKDDNDILWIGTDIGLQKITNRKPDLQVVKKNYDDPKNSFPNNLVKVALASKLNNHIVYTGIEGEGFSIYNQKTKKSFNVGPNGSYKNSERFVNQFYEHSPTEFFVMGQYNFQKVTINQDGVIKYIKTYFPDQVYNFQSCVPNPINPNQLIVLSSKKIFLYDLHTEKIVELNNPELENSIFNQAYIIDKKVIISSINSILQINPQNQNIQKIEVPKSVSIYDLIKFQDSCYLLLTQHLGLIKHNFYSNTNTTVLTPNLDYFPKGNNILKYKTSYWISSTIGLIKWNYLTNELRIFDTEDGLPSNVIFNISEKDGYLFLGTQQGMVIFNPDFQTSHFTLPKVDVTCLNVLNDNSKFLNPENGSEIVLTENQNSIKIDFTLLDFNLPEKNKFKFKFLPLNEDWVEPASGNTIIYNSLEPGTYKFELIGANSDQNWSADSFFLTIKIIPPFYKAKWFIYLLISFTLFSLFLIGYLRNKSLKKNKVLLEKIIKERTAEIQEQREELLDSINYAKRLQRAIFVGQETLSAELPNSFIYYKPKDKISGDFFWIGKLKEHLVVLVGDCTGHGVPGAMLSIIGTSLLNKIVYEELILDPGEILTRLNYLFYQQLNLKESNIRDGMDASVLVLNTNNKNVMFAGAKQDLVYIVNHQIQDIKAQRTSIGENETNQFSTAHIDYSPNRTFYLYSDGIKDQFGGEQNKKYSGARLKKLLLSNHTLSFNEQAKVISASIKDWRGDIIQTDDILVIGLKF